MPKPNTQTAGAKPAKEATPGAARERRDLDAERLEIEDSIRARATDRARKWARLVELLDAMLDQAHALDRFGIPLDPKLVAEHARATGAPLSWAGRSVESLTQAELSEALRVAHNRLATIDGFQYGSCEGSSVSSLAEIIEGKATFDTPQAAIAGARKEVEMLLRADLDQSRPLKTARRPAEMEQAVISVLLSAARALTQREIADEIVAGRNCDKQAVDEKGVSEAMGRLRLKCGYGLKKLKGGGFKLTDEEIELSKSHGLAVPPRRRSQSD